MTRKWRMPHLELTFCLLLPLLFCSFFIRCIVSVEKNMYALLNLFCAWGALRNLLFLFCVARAYEHNGAKFESLSISQNYETMCTIYLSLLLTILGPLTFDDTTMIESINSTSWNKVVFSVGQQLYEDLQFSNRRFEIVVSTRHETWKYSFSKLQWNNYNTGKVSVICLQDLLILWSNCRVPVD